MNVPDILNNWPPVVYAAAVWALFLFLDQQASPQAKKAISTWVRNRKVDKKEVGKVAVELFDALYTAPLWRWKAMLRVALLSIILSLLMAYHLYPYTFLAMRRSAEIRNVVLAQIGINIVSDYISLFLIRRWLIAEPPALLALLAAPFIGALVVVAVYLICDVGIFSLQTWTFDSRYFVDDLNFWLGRIGGRTMRATLMLPAMAVHLWLPLFAVALMSVRALSLAVATTRKAEWFFGSEHPLRAIGFVAAALVFIITAAAGFFH
jgi:hypothetical protein